MKDASSDVLVILVLLVTLIGGGAAVVMKRPHKLELYDVQDLVYIDDFLPQDISLASDEEIVDEFPCYRIVRK